MSRFLLTFSFPTTRPFSVLLQSKPALSKPALYKSAYQAKPSPRPPRSMTRFWSANNERSVIDGSFLHDDLAAAAVTKGQNFTLVYDRSLRENQISVSARSRGMFGRFHCTGCILKGHPREWSSAIVCTEFLFVDPPGRSNKTVQYRCSIHSQKCRGCEKYMEPGLDHDQYVAKALRGFELWTGNREAEENDDTVTEPQKPHDRKRCHGCQVGKCRLDQKVKRR